MARLARGAVMLTIRRDQAAIAAKAEADLASAKARASAEVVAWAQGFLDQFTAGYPTQETLAWGAKLAAARRVMAFGSDPLIEIEADALRITPVALAAKVVAKGETYERIVALTSAIRGATQQAIAEAGSVDDLPAILDHAKAAAELAMVNLGLSK